MRSSILRRAFLPPPFPEPLGSDAVRGLRLFRIAVVSSCILVDIIILLTLRDSSYLRPEVVDYFALINIPILTVDLGITFFFLKRPGRSFFPLHTFVIIIETFAAVAWIQVTGSLSSYFLVVAFLLITLFRFFIDYRTGVVAALAMYSFHLTAFILEEAGVLDRVALFSGDPGAVYAADEYRYIVFISITCGYALTIGGLNLVVHRLRATQAQLRQVESNLARVARGVAHGRLSGHSLGDYWLEELIGRGGMGEVYRARRDHDSHLCAVKILHPHLTDDPESLTRFEHEARAVARLPRHFVPEVYEIDLTGQECFIAMEYLQGEDLAARLRRRGIMPVAEVAELMAALADAVEAAHAAGVIHRDLKPRNIFVGDGADKSLEVRLLDFGVSKLLDREEPLTVTQALLGSPGFMSPEQARGDSRKVGPEADVFSLGAIAYLAISGERPFPVRELTLALHALLYEEPPLLSKLMPGVSGDVDAVLAIALAKEPASRFARPSELARGLASAATGDLDPAIRERGQTLIDRVEADTKTSEPRLDISSDDVG